MKSINKLLVKSIIIVAVVPLFCLADAILVVEGRIETKHLSQLIQPPLRTNHFRASVSPNDCRYKIHVTRDDLPHIKASVISFDGTNIYLVSYLDNSEERVGKSQLADVSIEADQGGIPRTTAGSIIGPVWLAYASRCLWSAPRTTLASAVYSMFYQNKPGDDRISLEFERRFDGMSNLVKKITFSGSATNGQELPNAIFEVIRFTNALHNAFPGEFQIKEYATERPGTAKRLIGEYKALLTNVTSSVEDVTFDAKIPSKGYSSFVDHRLESEHPRVARLDYVTNRVLSVTEVKATKAYSRAFSSDAAPRHKGNRLALILLGVALAAPFVMALMKYWRRGKQ